MGGSVQELGDLPAESPGPKGPASVVDEVSPSQFPGGQGRRIAVQQDTGVACLIISHDIALAGEPPAPIEPAPGWPFHPRRPGARDRFSRERPALAGAGGQHRFACFFPDELSPASG